MSSISSPAPDAARSKAGQLQLLAAVGRAVSREYGRPLERANHCRTSAGSLGAASSSQKDD